MKIYSIDDWKKYFPHDEPRKEQVEAIDFILDAFYNNSKSTVILELGTGVGKSAIGITIARHMIEHPIPNKLDDETDYKQGAYVLTTQKILQEQYMHDFGEPNGNLINIKSSSNYTCNFFKHQSCADSRQMLKYEPKGTKFFKCCTGNCVYTQAKAKFLKSNESITNYKYFLAESVYAQKIKPRELLVLDEVHNLTNELSTFIDIVFSERFANLFGIHMPEIATAFQAISWIKKEYIPSVNSFLGQLGVVIVQLKENFDKMQDKAVEVELAKQTKKYDRLDQHICKINRFIEYYSKDNWILNIVPAQDKSLRKLEFKPIDVSPYAKNLLFQFGKNLILMSATIINKETFCEPLGINADEVAYISIPSPFPFDNRPVFYAPVGKMSRDNIDNTLPKMAETIKMLLEHHKNDKGLIHCRSYKISNYIKKHVRNKRLLLHDTGDRDKILKEHLTSEKPTVLLSPSMTEGIDLYDDLARFQIICKIPFPYLGALETKKRMHKWKNWYAYETIKTIIQSIGRSIRNSEDYCTTYILDENFDYFHIKNRHLFPEWFSEVLHK